MKTDVLISQPTQRLLWTSALIPAVAGVALAMIAIRVAEVYGYVVFYGLPAVIPGMAAYLYNRKAPATLVASNGVALLSLFCTGAIAMLIALDGLICMLMALPLAAVISLPAAAVGRWTARMIHWQHIDRALLGLIALFPLLIAAEANLQPKPKIAPVTTSIEIDAPIQQVWKQIVSFPPITESPGLMFKLGIAYPINARIIGSGVGAVRYCEFSTGPFVEPITTWQPPHLLAFTVSSSPCPMKELSIYPELDVPHLHGFLKSEHGEFRLHESNGKTVVTGTTWYANDMAPEFYWRAISDQIIHSIHERVLKHIKHVAEAQAKE